MTQEGRDRTMTHDEYAELVAAYAIDALEPEARVVVEVHVTTCAACQADLADLRRVSVLLAQAIEPVAPPESLKARTMARATSQGSGASARGAAPAIAPATPVAAARGPSWLALAALLVISVGLGGYAWSLRSQIASLNQQFASAAKSYESLRTQLIAARLDAARLSKTVDVLRDPNVVKIDLRGAGNAAQGSAYVSRNGVTVQVSGLPVLPAGRVYQLWVITPNQTPISGGVFNVDATGSASLATPLPAEASGTRIVAVTEEAGPNGVEQSKNQPVMLGQVTQ
jgi:anti-sigma-K factor RskA